MHLVLAALLAIPVGPRIVAPEANAQEPVVSEREERERVRRERVRRERARVAAKIDALNANNDELEPAVRTLEDDVRAQDARLSDATREADSATRYAQQLSDELALTARTGQRHLRGRWQQPRTKPLSCRRVRIVMIVV